MFKVSVIIPCFNYAHFISEALDSVLRQTYANWECIIVDDGSTDNTKEVVSRYINRDKRFVYIYQQNKGLSAARNTGIREAKGDLVQFLDADDLIEPRKLELQAIYFEPHFHIDIVYGEVHYFSTEQPGERLFSIDGRNRPWMPKASGKGKDFLRYLIAENIMAVSCPLVSRKAIEACGLFDETLKACEDWDYWLRCALAGVYFKYDDKEDARTLVRFHKTSMSTNIPRMLTASITIREKLDKRLAEIENNKEIGKYRKFNKTIIRDLQRRLQDGGKEVSGFTGKKTFAIKFIRLLADFLRKIIR